LTGTEPRPIDRRLHARVARRLKRIFRRRPPLWSRTRSAPGARLNVGCGRFPIAGWINLDLEDHPGVDRVLDIRRGLPFRNVAFVYAEHFLEHLTLGEAFDFLRSAHRALAPDGRIRLSTPSLEWVWASHAPGAGGEAETVLRTLLANRAFYGWRHRFVWSRELLLEALESTGFRDGRFFAYGESDTPELRGLEQHETFEESPDNPHVHVVEAARGEFDPERLEALTRLARDHFVGHLPG